MIKPTFRQVLEVIPPGFFAGLTILMLIDGRVGDAMTTFGITLLLTFASMYWIMRQKPE